jgi:hypothetical protein
MTDSPITTNPRGFPPGRVIAHKEKAMPKLNSKKWRCCEARLSTLRGACRSDIPRGGNGNHPHGYKFSRKRR